MLAGLLKANCALTSLDTRGNDISGEAAQQLAQAVLGSASLEVFGGVPVKQLRGVLEKMAAGNSCTEAKAAGHTPQECCAAGFTLEEGKAAGYGKGRTATQEQRPGQRLAHLLERFPLRFPFRAMARDLTSLLHCNNTNQDTNTHEHERTLGPIIQCWGAT